MQSELGRIPSGIKNSIRNSRGQAVVEYVLLLFVVFIVMLSIILAIANSTEKFAQNYFGEYFQCLLELGELPALGSDGNSETECDDMYEPFTVADGRQIKFDLGVGGGFGPGGSSPESSRSEDAASSGGGDSEGSSGRSSGAHDGGSSRSQSSVFAEMGGRKKTVPLSNADKGSGADEDGLNGMASGTNSFEMADGSGSQSGRTKYVPIYGSMDAESEQAGENAAVKAQVESDPEQALRGRRVPATSGQTKDMQIEEGEEFTLGNFVKILIIVALVLIILVFFGGQVMQYTKSQE